MSLSVSGKQASRQANTLPMAFHSQIFSYFPVEVILVEYPVLLFLGKSVMDSQLVLSIFTAVWPYNFHVSW